MPSYKLTFAENATSKKWVQKELTLDELRDIIAERDIRESKEGLSFVAATLLDGKRNKNSVDEIHLIVYDFDGGESLDNVHAILDEKNLVAFLYTSHSHRSERTNIVVDHYEKWAKSHKKPLSPTLALMQEYLEDHGKRHLKNVRFQSDWYERIADKGNIYFVLHDPVDKFRVVLPLLTPIKISKLSPSNQKALEEYKSIYNGIGIGLGFKDFDTACSDPCRLFYLPSAPQATAATARTIEYDGDFLDWENYPRAPVSKKAIETKSGEETPNKAEEYVVIDANGKRVNLGGWLKRNDFSFDIEELLTLVIPDEIYAPRPNGGYTIRCPFEAEHTEAGGQGTFAANSDGLIPWVIHCQHNSCQSSGRRRLDFLKQWVVQGLVRAEDLMPAGEAPPLQEAAAAAGISVTTLPSRVTGEDAPAVNEDVVFPVKDIQDPAAVIKAARATLSQANWLATVEAAFNILHAYNNEHPDKALKFETDEFLEDCIDNNVSMKVLKNVYKQDAILINKTKDLEEFVTVLNAKRLEKRPLADAVSHLISMSYTGITLDKEISRLALWYDVHPRVIHRDYKANIHIENEMLLDQKLKEHYPKLRQQYAKLLRGERYCIVDMEKTRQTGELTWHTDTALCKFKDNTRVDIQERNKKGEIVTNRVPVVPHWLQNDREITEFINVTFDPNKFTPRTEDGALNLYPGVPYFLPPVVGDATMIRDHILHVWCCGNQNHYDWVAMFFADMFQHPGNKPHCSLAIVGDEGTGKSIIFEYAFAPVLGSMYVSTSKPKQLTGQFNQHAEGKLLWLAEESLFRGDNERMNVIKDLIASRKMTIEPKGVNLYTIPNNIRFAFTSNQLDALKLSTSDRRFCVLETSNAVKQDTKYNTKLKNWLIDEQGCQIWLNYLLQWQPQWIDKGEERIVNPAWNKDTHGENNLNWRDLFTPPMTSAKRAQIDMSIEPPLAFFIEIIVEGRLSSLKTNERMEIHDLRWPLDQQAVLPDVNTLKMMFDTYIGHHAPGSLRFDRNKFATLFEKFFGKKPSDYTFLKTVNGAKKRILILPERAQLLERCKNLGLIPDRDYDYAHANPDSHRAQLNTDNE